MADLHTEPQSALAHFAHEPAVEHRTKGRSRMASALGLLTFGGATAATALIGARATASSVDGWYDGLRKPSFTPPKKVFGPVWSGLYALVALSAWRVWKAPQSRRRKVSLGLWAAQLVLNAAWSPLFFGLRRPRSALVDLAALGAATVGYAVAARRVDPPAAAVMLPYLGWLAFAGALNEEIVRLNA
jgi:tryptophan-rich sensory protein